MKSFKVGDKVKINMKYLQLVASKLKGQDKLEYEEFIRKKGVVTIKSRNSGFSFESGNMKQNTQYLIDYDWRIGTGGIPLTKVNKVRH